MRYLALTRPRSSSSEAGFFEAGNNSMTITDDGLTGWAQHPNGATFIILHDSFGHNSTVATSQHLLNTGAHAASGLGENFYNTDVTGNLSSPFARANEVFANQFARSLGNNLGLASPADAQYGF